MLPYLKMLLILEMEYYIQLEIKDIKLDLIRKLLP